jgi:excisionase family DNA binding protein
MYLETDPIYAGGRESEAPIIANVITLQQAAEIIGVSLPTFERMIERDRIPVTTLGPRIRRIWLADLMAYLESKTE